MKRKRLYIAAAAAVVLIPLALFLHTFSASPLPMPAPYSGPLPSATPPKELAVFALVTGVNHRVAAYGYRGGSFFDRRDFCMAGALGKHPQGDLLIDTGFGRHIHEQIQTIPWIFRAMTSFSLWQPAADQLSAVGYDPKSLRAILLTHAHWDHVSCLPDFPGVPVWVTPPEREFIRRGGKGPCSPPIISAPNSSKWASSLPATTPPISSTSASASSRRSPIATPSSSITIRANSNSSSKKII
jgi:glyoxylase-like metal-dependent hydrolase (beta-lactamase superfamily II)